jgi:hypothetical protein
VRFSIEPLHDRELLQPVDICAHSAAPEAANQGLWYFASQIASSEVKLRRALADDEYARALVERYVDNLGDAVAAWRSLGKHDPGQPLAMT